MNNEHRTVYVTHWELMLLNWECWMFNCECPLLSMLENFKEPFRLHRNFCTFDRK